jgi:hypothetical protein
MGIVVERGLARCPRCVAVADYTFTELGPGSLSYEVDCKRCGERYREVHGPTARKFGTDAVADWMPDVPPASANYERMLAWLSAAQSRGKAAASGATAWLSAWTHSRSAELGLALRARRGSAAAQRKEPNGPFTRIAEQREPYVR